MHRFTFLPHLIVKNCVLITLLAVLLSCEKNESNDETDKIDSKHESILNNNSGWSSIAFDSEIFYPYGGFSGFDRIELSTPFVHNSQPKAVANYFMNGSSGSSANIVAVVNNEVIRQPLTGNGETIVGKDNLYRFSENDEHVNYVRRLNAPDYTTYNSFEWKGKNIEKEVNKLGHIVGNYIRSGTPDFYYSNDSLYAIQTNYLNIREGGNGAAQQRVVVTGVNMSQNGFIDKIVLLPYYQDLALNYYLDLKTKYINGRSLTIGLGSEQRTAYLMFGSFDHGFSFIKTIENVRGITAFYKGTDNFYCALKQGGSSQNIAFKIDLKGNVTELGTISRVHEYAFSHFKGDMVVAINENQFTDSARICVKKITAEGSENLGSSSLTKATEIELLISDGDQLFGAAVNELSPQYQGGGRQFLGWEFIKYNQ